MRIIAYIEKDETALKTQFIIRFKKEGTVMRQINNLLREREMELPDDQEYIIVSLKDRKLYNYSGYIQGSITLYVEPNDFRVFINKKGKGFVRISSVDCEYIEYGMQNGSKHIAANPYYFIRELTKEIKNQLEVYGKLIDLMEADKKFDYSFPDAAQKNPGERYDDIVQNNYYILRLSFVYFLVYYRMFRSLLNRLPLDRPIRLHIL